MNNKQSILGSNIIMHKWVKYKITQNNCEFEIIQKAVAIGVENGGRGQHLVGDWPVVGAGVDKPQAIANSALRAILASTEIHLQPR
jgi:hypothetical protein